MATARAAGLEGHGRATGAVQERKVNLSQRVQELHTIIALQGAAPLALQGQAGGALGPPPVILPGTNSALMSSRAREEVIHTVV